MIEVVVAAAGIRDWAGIASPGVMTAPSARALGSVMPGMAVAKAWAPRSAGSGTWRASVTWVRPSGVLLIAATRNWAPGGIVSSPGRPTTPDGFRSAGPVMR